MKKDPRYFMNIALKLALKARNKTSPNPVVGAVVVKKGKIVGTGFHQKAGFAHAEVVAINNAGQLARGGSLYVTLEPCTHFGRTPPCVDRIIKSGISEVFVGMVDPNPLNNGRGIEILKKAGIKVSVGFLEEELRQANQVFIKYITRKVPYITVKVGQSLDGKIATAVGDSKWITSDRSRVFAHRMRSEYDAIIVGVNTVLRDNPSLNAWFSKKHLIKVVVDSQLSTPANSNIFSPNAKVILVTLPSKPGQETENRKVLAQKAEILEVKAKDGQVNLTDMMKRLARKEIANCLVEGGGTLIGSLFDEGLVDRVVFFVSPKIIGGKDAISSVMGKGVPRVDKAAKLKRVKLRRLGDDFMVEGYLH